MVAGSEGERWPRKSEEWWGACGSAECHLIEKGLTTDEDGEGEVGRDAAVRVRARVRLGSRRDTRKGVVTKVGNEVKKYGWRAKQDAYRPAHGATSHCQRWPGGIERCVPALVMHAPLTACVITLEGQNDGPSSLGELRLMA